MFWKLVISILLLPSCLGLEIATATEKNRLQMLPTPENIDVTVVQTKENQDVMNSFVNSAFQVSSIDEDKEGDTEKLKHRKHRHHYRRYRSHRRYHHRRQYRQRYRNHYRHRPYYPENIHYRRRYHERYNNHYQGVYDPLYCHYLRHHDYRHGNYRQGC